MEKWLRLPPKKCFDLLKEVERLTAEKEEYEKRIKELESQYEELFSSTCDYELLLKENKEMKDIIRTYQKTIEAFKYIRRI